MKSTFIDRLKRIQKSTGLPLDSSIPQTAYFPIDLSAERTKASHVNTNSSLELGIYIDRLLSENNATVGYGGYLETRSIYNRSGTFKTAGASENDRNIHLGIDFWATAGTAVVAPLAGTVESVQNNLGIGDYGPTVILKHEIDELTFYTLYGHLSRSCLDHLKVDTSLNKGDRIGELGNSAINGDYPPHLHFQLIHDLGDWVGDYPGVCSIVELDFYRNNCPDPQLILPQLSV